MDRNIIVVRFVGTVQVVPYVGTWIEMPNIVGDEIQEVVVPYVGTWIEIRLYYTSVILIWSFPTWERG